MATNSPDYGPRPLSHSAREASVFAAMVLFLFVMVGQSVSRSIGFRGVHDPDFWASLDTEWVMGNIGWLLGIYTSIIAACFVITFSGQIFLQDVEQVLDRMRLVGVFCEGMIALLLPALVVCLIHMIENPGTAVSGVVILPAALVLILLALQVGRFVIVSDKMRNDRANRSRREAIGELSKLAAWKRSDWVAGLLGAAVVSSVPAISFWLGWDLRGDGYLDRVTIVSVPAVYFASLAMCGLVANAAISALAEDTRFSKASAYVLPTLLLLLTLVVGVLLGLLGLPGGGLTVLIVALTITVVAVRFWRKFPMAVYSERSWLRGPLHGHAAREFRVMQYRKLKRSRKQLSGVEETSNLRPFVKDGRDVDYEAP